MERFLRKTKVEGVTIIQDKGVDKNGRIVGGSEGGRNLADVLLKGLHLIKL